MTPAYRVHVIAHLGHTLPPLDADDADQAKAEAIKQVRDSLWLNDIGYTDDYTAEIVEILLPAPIVDKPELPILVDEDICPKHDIPLVQIADRLVCTICQETGGRNV